MTREREKKNTKQRASCLELIAAGGGKEGYEGGEGEKGVVWG